MTSSISQPAPAETVAIGIGGTTVRLHSSDSHFRSMVRERYCSFLAGSADADFDFDIELLERPSENTDDDVQVQVRNDEWLMRRGDFDACWSTNSRRGTVRQANSSYATDSVLRIVHSIALAQRGGFLMHAASAIRNGKAFLFAGVSGAGKTTISRLAPTDCVLLSDEISYVRPHGKTYVAYGTPFSGELGKPGENRCAPVETVFLLEKGPSHHIEAVPDVDAVRRLLRNILFFAEDASLVHMVFQSACEFAQSVPIKKLVFKPEQSVWDMIR